MFQWWISFFFYFLKSNWNTWSSSIRDDSFNNEIINIKNLFSLNQAEIISAFTIDLLKESKKWINKITKNPFPIKIGFHSGSAVGGIIGHKNDQYCLFSDTINTVQ